MLYHKPFTSEECTYLVLLSANAQENLTSLNDMGHAYSTQTAKQEPHKVEFIYKESSGEG